MKPEIVLNIKPGDNPETVCDAWLKEYKAYTDEFTNTAETAAWLSARAKRACKLILERNKPERSHFRGDMFYEEESRRMNAENAELDGDFPLGNEQDALFAGTYFTIRDLVSIQLGYNSLVDCGYYTEYNYAVLARKGFIAELNGEWLEAVHCYEGAYDSEAVQKREYMCRRKAKEKGTQLYAEAQRYMESGQWSEVFKPLQEAADMGNTDALTDLGLARIYGQYGCAKDAEEALRLLRTAANCGNARAADAGSVKAMIVLGDRELRDTQISFSDAAVSMNDTEGQSMTPETNIIQQHKKQLAWYELAAHAGDLSAIQAVCNSYMPGYPVERDDQKAFLWASLGADEGDGFCMYMMAYLYENGVGADNDTDAAIMFYAQAAEQGVRSAMLRLAQIYSVGTDGVPADPGKAAHYLFLSGEGRG